ncbi:tRNA lysidine(34) synthetase TilS [Holzapfeliella sp. JNUCC 72]
MNQLRQAFKENLKSLQIDERLAKIVVAVSAGPDSMALLDLLYHSLYQPKEQLIIAHVNHQLRADSKQELAVLTQYAQEKGLTIENYDWPKKHQPKTGIEAAARNMRYQFLHQVQAKWQADYVMTAHHGNDVLETMMLKLVRSGDAQEMSSLAVKRPFFDGYLVRPLLIFSKKQLVDYLKVQQITYVIDETNHSDFTLRNRIRHHVMPIVEKETNHLIENGQRYQQSVAKLTQAQVRLFELVTTIKPVTTRLYQGKIKDFTKIPDTNWSDYLSYLTTQTFSDKVFLSEQQFKQLKHILIEGGALTITKNIQLLIKNDDFFLMYPPVHCRSKLVGLNQPILFCGQQYLVSEDASFAGYDCLATFDVPLNQTLYLGFTPDQLVLLSNGQHQKVKKVFAKANIPTILKGYYLSIYGSDIYWIQNIYHYNSLPQQSRKLYFFVAK